jgi:two-component system response regulator RpaA
MASVMVVDDEPSLRTLTRLMLARLGYNVSDVAEGITGEAMALDLKPDVILLDIMMPDQDGFTTCQHLRANGYTGKIVFVSALTDYEGTAKAAAYGADGYIEKPLTVDILRQQMAKLLPSNAA